MRLNVKLQKHRLAIKWYDKNMLGYKEWTISKHGFIYWGRFPF